MVLYVRCRFVVVVGSLLTFLTRCQFRCLVLYKAFRVLRFRVSSSGNSVIRYRKGKEEVRGRFAVGDCKVDNVHSYFRVRYGAEVQEVGYMIFNRDRTSPYRRRTWWDLFRVLGFVNCA